MDTTAPTLLREIKEATKWSETRLAKELDTSQPTVHRILKGQVDCMARTYNAIAALHIQRCPLIPGRRLADRLPDERVA